MLTRQVSAAERRIKPRRPAAGQVQLRQAQMPGVPFLGRLMDVSETGFRVHHDRFTLGSGELLSFEFSDRSGLACVVWNRIAGKQVETGFRICQDSDLWATPCP
jgi:hypothetical protein